MPWYVTTIRPPKVEVDIDGRRWRAVTVKELFKAYSWTYCQKGERLNPGWELPVWEALAKKYPRHVRWRGPESLKKASPSSLKLVSAVSFLKFAAKHLMDRRLVSAAEAHRRAAICAECPLKSSIGGCPVCKDSLKAIVKNPPEKTVAPEGCLACNCYMPVKVWIRMDQLAPSRDHYQWAPDCWMLEGTEAQEIPQTESDHPDPNASQSEAS